MNNYSYCLAKYYQIIDKLEVPKKEKGKKKRDLFNAARERFFIIDNKEEDKVEQAYKKNKSTIHRYLSNGNVLLEAFPDEYPKWLDKFPSTKAQLLAKAKLANNLLYQNWTKEIDNEEDTTNHYEMWKKQCKERTGK